jgi:VWFA-related protein
MNHKLVLPFVILFANPLCVAPVAQTRAPTDAPQTQTFGSSLRRPRSGTPDRPDKGLDPQAAASESPEEVVTVNTSLVLLDVLVTDRTGTRAVEGLTKDDFVVVEDGRPQELSFFALGDDAQKLPRSIVLILDRSQSQLAYIEASVEAAKKLVNQLAPTDEMAIVTDDVQLALGFTRDKKRLKSALESLKKYTLEGYKTRSLQFSALLATLRELVDVEKRRAVIILQTDGDEVARLGRGPSVSGGQGSPYAHDMDDVYAEAERSRARIYSVVPNERLLGLPAEEVARHVRATQEKRRAAQEKYGDMWYGMRRLPPEKQERPATFPPAFAALGTPEVLQKMRERREQMEKQAVEVLVEGQAAAARVAELTGGWVSFLERPEEADAVYGRILADINRRYVLGYYPTNKALDRRLRQLKVEVRGHPEYLVQGRQSYSALPR